MGDFADTVVEGLIDGETGELIDGTAPGYPRSSSRIAKRNRKHKREPLLTDGRVFCLKCGRLIHPDGMAEHERAKHSRK
jgi:hypothetical protein